MFPLHLAGNLLCWQHIHLLYFHVMDQTYGFTNTSDASTNDEESTSKTKESKKQEK